MLAHTSDVVRKTDASDAPPIEYGRVELARPAGEKVRVRWFDRFLPSSLTGIIGLALTAIVVPLLLGTVGAAVQMRDLSSSSEQLVLNGVLATRYTQSVVRQVAVMERSARLYQILRRQPLLDAVREVRGTLDTTLDDLARLPGDPARAELIVSLRETADRAVVATAALGASPGGSLQTYSDLARSADELSRLAADQTQSELAELRGETERARRRLYWQSAALLPVTLALILLFTRMIGRPLSAMDAAIADIGHGRLARPVAIGGPSDLQALGRQLEWLRGRLIEIADERNRFLRHMSHELKTPLANIREASELLIEGAVGGLAPEQREVAGIMRDNSLRLQRLIENLLSFSEWESRQGALELRDFELRPLVQAAVGDHQLQIGARRIHLRVDVPDIVLRADRAKLRMIVDNLLSNAVKFTPDSGTITVSASTNEDWLVLEVADTGPGIAPADRERIFDAFYQGATPAGSLVRGTGIGLSVVKEFVRAQGGTIEVLDGESPGAHFRIGLPLVVSAESVESRTP